MEKERVAIKDKMNLTVAKAAEYSNIGINKINSMLLKPNCLFVLFVGIKKPVKRKAFEEFVEKTLII